jgi:hypothetical protein
MAASQGIKKESGECVDGADRARISFQNLGYLKIPTTQTCEVVLKSCSLLQGYAF